MTLTALGGGPGIAAVISAVRRTNREARDVVPVPPVPESPVSPPAPPVNPPAFAPGRPPYGVRDGASWSVGLGGLAYLLAGTLVGVVGATTMPLDATWIRVLKWTVVAAAVPAIALGGWSRFRPGKPERALLTMRVGAGCLAASGALLTTLVAGVS